MKFAKGNKAAVGHKDPRHEYKIALATAVQRAVTPDDIRDIVQAMVQKAKKGDTFAAREVLDRVLGKPDQAITGEIHVHIDR